MNIVSWNVRGLGRPAKRYIVSDFLELYKVNVVCIKESKLALVDQSIWCSIGGGHFDYFYFIP